MKKIDHRIGERVLLARRRSGMTQHDLAARVQMSPTSINRLERGLQSVYAEGIGAIAETLGVSADYLLGLADDDPEEEAA